MSDYQVGRMHDGERYAVILYTTGRKLITWASIDSPLGLHTGPLSDERYISPRWTTLSARRPARC